MKIDRAIAEIHLDAITNNFTVASAHSPRSKVMAVIKADAYGHGILPVAQRLTMANAFGVARMDEAVVLREGGIKLPITLLEGVLTAAEVDLAISLKLDVVVHSEHHLTLLKGRSGLGLWIKIETGMHRLGLAPKLWQSYIPQLKCHRILGLMSHLANADGQDKQSVAAQCAIFSQETESVSMDKSLANSGGILAYPMTHAEWIRPGIMLYGATPFRDLKTVPSLQPAMTLSAPIIAIQNLEAGNSVGYGGLWVAKKTCRVAVIAIGYGDGYPREAPADTQVLVNGVKRNLVGRVSMDMLMVELVAGDEVSIGDAVCLWGKGLPVEELSARLQTIPLTLLCGVTKRVPRIYLAGDNPSGF